ncbi:GNAT family N-acetyltransferase [Bacillus thuringiensis]|uniref:GNAT family N-acetyltransferase n=1 Tax=Bacillus thuringiensis TaxID=1428 RepID=UPI001E2EF04E|nr:GNAT family N-acetyltransferase [Bacillus thuringiensis]MEB8931924.1 GNAT family N-acetyltransferase [Bacillus cereus]MCR6790109.1 GNAT family N-acetyltransferase [Bacillus thuringiensis]MCR6820584.1 GNAT family N-acetyltransferase [Bacillus thuringiensis]MCR6832021.1 GNAT family N-acetyltransferase [Bacillus thuringiensis]MEB9915126.1 GNAT family N-acetyltransferase [Bacillus cereus]
MRNNMKIKLATLDEVNQIEILYQELFLKMSKLQPEYIKPAKQDVEFIKKTINEKDSDILIAEIDNCIIGFLLIQELITPSYTCLVEHKYAFITDILVGNKYQHQGIGSALLFEGKKWAKNRNLDYLELNVLSENIGAIALYEKQRFRDVSHTMRYEF